MRKKSIERQLAHAVRHITPDVLDAVLEKRRYADAESALGGIPAVPTGTELGARPVRRTWVPRAAFAAALLIAMAGSLAGYLNLATYAVLDLDVNPSFELRLNRRERVFQVAAFNEEAERILDGMDLRGTTADVAVNALIGSMVKNGYIDNQINALLISVDARNEVFGDSLSTQLAQSADDLLRLNAVDGAVISQRYTLNDEVKALSGRLGVSPGKVALMSELIAQNPALTYDTLSVLSVRDLNLILSSKATLPDVMTLIGTANSEGYIGNENAIRTALNHQGLSREQVRSISCEMDMDYGRMVYEVEFYVGNHEYEYVLDARDGQLLEWEIEWKYSGYDD